MEKETVYAIARQIAMERTKVLVNGMTERTDTDAKTTTSYFFEQYGAVLEQVRSLDLLNYAKQCEEKFNNRNQEEDTVRNSFKSFL